MGTCVVITSMRDAFAGAFLIIMLLIIIYRRNAAFRTKRRTQIPPGTLGIPFFGETIEFITRAHSDRPESFMDRRRLLYGKVFKSHLFGGPMIVSTDAEVSRIILQSDSSLLIPSYPKSLCELMGKSSILLVSGNLQRRIHGLIGSFLKSTALKAQITGDMQRYLDTSMDKWRDGQLVYIQDEAKYIAFQVLVKALTRLGPGEETELLRSHFKEFSSGLMSLPLKIPGTQFYRSLQAKKEMVKLVQRIIQSRRGDEASGTPKDAIQLFLDDGHEEFTDELICDNIVDMMIPGEDSVPMLITLAIKYLSDCPAALHQLTEENMKLKHDKAKLKTELCWNDYISLPFTQSVITETLRMGSIIIGVIKKAVKDIEVKGYSIPKGWCVLTYFRSVHLDEDYYDCPYQFHPWRWLGKETSSLSFTPFGGGQRLCPGLELSRLEASIFLHHLVTRFRLSAEEDKIVHFPTARMKKRMPIRVQRLSDKEVEDNSNSTTPSDIDEQS